MLQKLTLLLKVALGFSFLGLFIYSINKLVDRKVGNKTYIDRASSFYPTITICPCPYNSKEVNLIHTGDFFEEWNKISPQICIRKFEELRCQMSEMTPSKTPVLKPLVLQIFRCEFG